MMYQYHERKQDIWDFYQLSELKCSLTLFSPFLFCLYLFFRVFSCPFVSQLDWVFSWTFTLSNLCLQTFPSASINLPLTLCVCVVLVFTDKVRMRVTLIIVMVKCSPIPFFIMEPHHHTPNLKALYRVRSELELITQRNTQPKQVSRSSCKSM